MHSTSMWLFFQLTHLINCFSGVKLLEGFMKTGVSVTEQEIEKTFGSSSRRATVKSKKVVSEDIWTAREIDDCINEGEKLRKALIKSIEFRLEKGVNQSLRKLEACLDLHGLLTKLCGAKSVEKPTPYDDVDLYTHGIEEFSLVLQHLSKLPAVKQCPSINLHPALSSKIFEKIKCGLASVIWGDNFTNVGAAVFEMVDGPLKGNTLADLPGDAFVTEFSIVES